MPPELLLKPLTWSVVRQGCKRSEKSGDFMGSLKPKLIMGVWGFGFTGGSGESPWSGGAPEAENILDFRRAMESQICPLFIL